MLKNTTVEQSYKLQELINQPTHLPSFYIDRSRLIDQLNLFEDSSPIIYITAPYGFGKSSLIKQWLYTKPNNLSLWLKLNKSSKTTQAITELLSNSISNHDTTTYNKIKTGAQKQYLVIEHTQHIQQTYWQQLLQIFLTEQRNNRLVLILLGTELSTKTIQSLGASLKVLDSYDLAFTETEIIEVLLSTKEQTYNKQNNTQKKLLNETRQLGGWPLLIRGLRNFLREYREPINSNSEPAQAPKNLEELDTLPHTFLEMAEQLITTKVLNKLDTNECQLLHYIASLPFATLPMLMQLMPTTLIHSNETSKNSTVSKIIVFEKTIATLHNKQLLHTDEKTGQIKLSHPWVNHLYSHPTTLEQHLEVTLPDRTKTNALLNKAADWYQHNQHITFAIEAHIQLEQWPLAADLIEAHAPGLTKGNDWQKLIDWLEKLPKIVFESRSQLMMLLAWESISLLRKSKAQDYINQAGTFVNHLKLRSKSSQQLTNDTSTPQSPLHKLTKTELELELNNPHDLTESLGLILEKKSFEQRSFLQHALHRYLPEKACLKNFLKSLQYYCQGNLKQANTSCLELLAEAKQEKNATLALNGLYLISQILFQQGLLYSIEDHTQEVTQWLTEAGFNQHPLFIWAQGCLVHSLREQGLSEQAAIILEKLENAFDHPQAHIIFRYSTLILKSCWLQSQFQLDQALETVEKSENLAAQLPFQFTHQLLSARAVKADILLVQERYEEAQALMTPLPIYWHNNPQKYNLQTTAITAFLWGLARKVEQMEETFDHLINITQALENRYCQLYTQTLHCLVLYKIGEKNKALKLLMPLLNSINKTPFIRILLNRGKCFGNLLLYANQKKPNHTSLSKWLQLLKHEPYHSYLHYDFIKLSKREVEVLSLLAQGNSNDEISQKLCRSLGTIKLHVHNIYKKLGVSSRIQAIQKCQACGFDTELMS